MRARTSRTTLLAVVLLIAVGCGGGGGKNDDSSSLTFWTAEDNPDRVKATQAIIDLESLELMIRAFRKCETSTFRRSLQINGPSLCSTRTLARSHVRTPTLSS